MKFQLGNTAGSGRKKGSKNKVTNKLRASITAFLTDNFQTVKDDFTKMPARERAKLFVDLLQYGLPKLQALSHELGFERLSDDELNEIITTLINKSNEGE